MKVHNCAITHIKFSGSGDYLAVVSKKGEIFFFKCESTGALQLKPLCMYPLNVEITCIVWNRLSTHLLVGCKSGSIFEIAAPIEEECDTSETYLREDLDKKESKIMMMEFQKPQKDEDDFLLGIEDKRDEVEVEWDPEPILSISYYNSDCNEFIVAAEGPYAGYYYKMSFDEERPLQAIPSPMANTRYMKWSDDDKYLLCGTDGGEVYIRPRENIDSYMQIRNHDQDLGKIKVIFRGSNLLGYWV